MAVLNPKPNPLISSPEAALGLQLLLPKAAEAVEPLCGVPRLLRPPPREAHPATPQPLCKGGSRSICGYTGK